MIEVVENVFTLTVRILTQTAEFFFLNFEAHSLLYLIPTKSQYLEKSFRFCVEEK